MRAAGCPLIVLLSNGGGPVSAAGCTWADRLHNANRPVWLRRISSG